MPHSKMDSNNISLLSKSSKGSHCRAYRLNKKAHKLIAAENKGLIRTPRTVTSVSGRGDQLACRLDNFERLSIRRLVDAIETTQVILHRLNPSLHFCCTGVERYRLNPGGYLDCRDILY